MPASLRERVKTVFSMTPWAAVAACVIVALYANYILAFFPNKHGLLGHDWQYVLPAFLDGYYSAITEGYFNIPWFTPAFCGGIPKFPNPQDLYFTLPQVLMFLLLPVDAARVTVLVFGAAGFAGTYFLLRLPFKCGKPAALFGATVFLFNGFYSVGMVMGHFTKHPFMLLPICAFLLVRAGAQNSVRAAAVSAAAACFAYTAYSGGYVLLLIMCAAIFGIGLLALLHDAGFSFKRFAAASAAAAFLALLLSAAKIAAVMSFMQSFPRDFYALPGILNLSDLPRFFFNALFGDAASLAASDVFFSQKWAFDMHEFDFGITWVPALLVFAGCFAGLKSVPPLAKMSKRAALAAAAFLLLMVLPLALNYLSPVWRDFLKSVPVIKNSSSNLRWLAVYIPLFSVLAALSLEKLFKTGAAKWAAGLLCAAAVVAITMHTDRSYYHGQPYNPKNITAAYLVAGKEGHPPPIDGLAAFVKDGVPVAAVGRNDFLVIGKSSLICYEPVFGYGLEAFPFKSLHLGPVGDVADGALNIKNPACFVFPKENGCAPGDHFKTGEAEKASLFTRYKGFEFQFSTVQRIANYTSLAAWIFLIAAWAYWGLRKAASERGFSKKPD